MNLTGEVVFDDEDKDGFWEVASCNRVLTTQMGFVAVEVAIPAQELRIRAPQRRFIPMRRIVPANAAADR